MAKTKKKITSNKATKKNQTSSLQFNSQREMIANTFTTIRGNLLNKLLNPGKDINFECGYPDVIGIDDYKGMYERNGAANRIVKIMPMESWVIPPIISENEDAKETEFEKEWKALDEDKHILAMLQRVDVLSGIGEFGVLLLGLSDGRALHLPVPGINPVTGEKTEGSPELKLLYLKAFDESSVMISQKEADVTSPRFGFPVKYSINFQDASAITNSKKALVVHWTRIIHIADGRESSDTYGTPRMKLIYNRLLDIRKILGGSAEMFWKGGFPGLALETHPELGDAPMDTKAAKEELEKYMNSTQRYLAFEGIQVKSLEVQIASPKDNVEVQMRNIAFSMGIPWRVFLGSEEAKLASTQDTKTWNKRIAARHTYYLDPYVIRPLIDRLILFGILSEVKKYIIEWPDLNAPSDEDKATVAKLLTEAFTKYVAVGGDELIPPMEFLTVILGFTREVAEAIEKAAGSWVDFGKDDEEDIAKDNILEGSGD